jgi:hypothetical protein
MQRISQLPHRSLPFEQVQVIGADTNLKYSLYLRSTGVLSVTTPVLRTSNRVVFGVANLSG